MTVLTFAHICITEVEALSYLVSFFYTWLARDVTSRIRERSLTQTNAVTGASKFTKHLMKSHYPTIRFPNV